ncbi:MAG: N-acyl homoserine lactonase family protein [Xanthobacteraceae bacterium]|nr:N-acyl homoserine lactonase family protein [Xanthobacteraceae bacterium]
MNWRIRPLLLGEAEVPNVLDVFWSLSTDRGRSSVPILGFLLISPGGEPVVVDCGMRDPKRAVDVHRLGPHACSPEQSLHAQLALHGVKPADVKTLILTHLHYDHAGQCAQLPSARIVVQRTELMAAAAPMGPSALSIGGKSLFYDRADVAELVDPLWDRVDLIEGDVTLLPGLDCVLYADSHTPGHQCIYVQTASGTAAIVGDIARKVDLNIGQAIPPGIYYDLEKMRRALADIGRRAGVVLPTHDWDTMERGKIG